MVDILFYTIFYRRYSMAFWNDLWNSMRTWVTDWYKSDVLKEYMERQARAHRKPVSESLLKASGRDPKDYGLGLPANPTAEELFNAFMFSGVDYRGQAQHAFETLGYGGGVTFSVDFAKIFIPPGVSSFLTASISANFSAKRASHRFIFIANQGSLSEFPVLPGHQPLAPPPQHTEAWRARAVTNLINGPQKVPAKTWRPIVLSCMLGKWTNMKGGLGVAVGAKFDTSSITNISISGMDALGFSVNLTASANAGLEGTWVFATDPTPVHMERDHSHMCRWFTDHLQSTSSEQKKEFKQSLAEIHLDVNPSCYLSWWIHTKEASAGLNAGASATAAIPFASTFNDQTVGPGASFSLAVKLPTIKWTAKTSSYRINNPCSNPDIVLSQETKVLYKQVGGQLFGLAMEMELGCAVVKPNPATYKSTNTVEIGNPQTAFIPQMTQKVDTAPSVFSNYYDKTEHGGSGLTKITETVSGPDMDLIKKGNFKATLTSKSLKMTFLEDTFKKLEKGWETVNSMSYEAGIAFWSQEKRTLMEGSGFAVGQSITLPSLIMYMNSFAECRTLFGREKDIPLMEDVKKLVNNVIKTEFPTEESIMLSVDHWMTMTDTGDWRRAIKAVDEGLKAYWKHMSSPPWNGPAAHLESDLWGRARINCPRQSDTGDNAEQYDRRLCNQLLHLLLEEAKTRNKLFTSILDGINKWFVSKGGEQASQSNKRFPGVHSLHQKCIFEMQQLDYYASALDVCQEYLRMRTLEAGLAESLHVGIHHLRTFLRDEGMQGAVKDIVNLQRFEQGQVPGAFLIESSFKLPSGKLAQLSHMPATFRGDAVDLQNDFSKAMKMELEGNFDGTLQYISIRYRLADTKTANRSFKLGVNIGAAALGFSLDRIRSAGSEGNFMVSTKWFNQYQHANDTQSGGWPDKTVPMPVILI